MSDPLAIRLRSGFATETEINQAADEIERLRSALSDIAQCAGFPDEYSVESLGGRAEDALRPYQQKAEPK